MSSIPSSVMSHRPIRDKRGRVIEDRVRKRGRERENHSMVSPYYSYKYSFLMIYFFSKNARQKLQILEDHVITLARGFTELSAEVRSQHRIFQVIFITFFHRFLLLFVFLIQDVEDIRNELSSLRVATRTGGAMSYNPKLPNKMDSVLWNPLESGPLSLRNPGRVKKLINFFGHEPPLVKMFLKNLGYEVSRYQIDILRFIY